MTSRTTSRPYRRWGRGRESDVSPSGGGGDNVIAEVKFSISSNSLSFRWLITWPPGLSEIKKNNKKNKSFFALNLNVYINLDNRERARARNK